MDGFAKVRTIKSHIGVTRFYMECAEDAIGWVNVPREIPQPYAFGAKPVSMWEREGKPAQPVVVVEVAHKVYQVFTVPKDLIFQEQD
jgi:hypothetical protein